MIPESVDLSVGFVVGTAFGTLFGALCVWAHYCNARQLWESAAFVRGRDFERELAGQPPVAAQEPPPQTPQHPVRQQDDDENDTSSWGVGA